MKLKTYYQILNIQLILVQELPGADEILRVGALGDLRQLLVKNRFELPAQLAARLHDEVVFVSRPHAVVVIPHGLVVFQHSIPILVNQTLIFAKYEDLHHTQHPSVLI